MNKCYTIKVSDNDKVNKTSHLFYYVDFIEDEHQAENVYDASIIYAKDKINVFLNTYNGNMYSVKTEQLENVITMYANHDGKMFRQIVKDDKGTSVYYVTVEFGSANFNMD